MVEEKRNATVGAIRYDWETYEIRLTDIEGNETVTVEFAWLSTSSLLG